MVFRFLSLSQTDTQKRKMTPLFKMWCPQLKLSWSRKEKRCSSSWSTNLPRSLSCRKRPHKCLRLKKSLSSCSADSPLIGSWTLLRFLMSRGRSGGFLTTSSKESFHSNPGSCPRSTLFRFTTIKTIWRRMIFKKISFTWLAAEKTLRSMNLTSRTCRLSKPTGGFLSTSKTSRMCPLLME